LARELVRKIICNLLDNLGASDILNLRDKGRASMTANFMDQFEVLKNVTKEFFVIPEDGSPMGLKFTSAFTVDETLSMRQRKSKNDEKREPMEVADCVNLVTGEEGRLIGNAVVKSELRNSYPDDGYVGLMFKFEQGEKRKSKDGQTYRAFKISEIKLSSNGDAKGNTKK
jgi:hypothetical protein